MIDSIWITVSRSVMSLLLSSTLVIIVSLPLEAYENIGPNKHNHIGRFSIDRNGLISGFALDLNHKTKAMKYQVFLNSKSLISGGIRIRSSWTNIKLKHIDQIYKTNSKSGFLYRLPNKHRNKKVFIRVQDRSSLKWTWIKGSGSKRRVIPQFEVAKIPNSVCTGKFDTLRTELTKHFNGLQGTNIEFKVNNVFNKLGYGGNINTGVTPQEFIDLQPKWGGSSSNQQIAAAVVDLAIAGFESANRLPSGTEEKVKQLIPEYGWSWSKVNDVNIAFHNQIDYLQDRNGNGQYDTEILRLVNLRSEWQQDLKEDISKTGLAHALAGDLNTGQILTEFWFNHFNVNSDKTYNHTMDYERKIRKLVCGSFLDLLRLSVTHPAMLLYLDQRSNVMTGTSSMMLSGQGTGVNENYARELLELHTFGKGPNSLSEPDSPYNQTDVHRVAKLLTGWSYTVGHNTFPYFNFDPEVHDNSRDPIMGRTFATGIQGGYDFIKYLASHPQTKRNVCTKLATEFHNERDIKAEIDPWLIQKCINSWGQYGDLPAMYTAIVGHWRFLNYTNHNSDLKNPMEVVVTGSRQMGFDLERIKNYDHLARLTQASKDLGINPRRVGPPTGYPLGDSAWMTSNYISQAQNFAFHFADHNLCAYDQGIKYCGKALESQIMHIASTRGANVALDKIRFGALKVKPRYFGFRDGADQLLESIMNPDRDHPNYNMLPVRTINSLILGSREFLLK